jgi:uncharacterized membrane protein (UPF0127 family)
MFVCAMNESKGAIVAPRVKVASSLWARSVGLLGAVSLSADKGLWLKPCRSIHTFFMRFPIDVLFLDRQGIVLFKATLVPWRFSRWERQAGSVLELAAGTLARTKTDVGDRISFRDI